MCWCYNSKHEIICWGSKNTVIIANRSIDIERQNVVELETFVKRKFIGFWFSNTIVGQDFSIVSTSDIKFFLILCITDEFHVTFRSFKEVSHLQWDKYVCWNYLSWCHPTKRAFWAINKFENLLRNASFEFSIQRITLSIPSQPIYTSSCVTCFINDSSVFVRFETSLSSTL